MSLTIKEAINEARLPVTRSKLSYIVYKTQKGYSSMPTHMYAGEKFEAILRNLGDSIIVEKQDGKKIDQFSITKKKPVYKAKAKSKRGNNKASDNAKDKSEELLSSDGDGKLETPSTEDS